MESDAHHLLTLGLLLILALFAEAVGRHTRIPRISLLVLLGFVLGPAALDMIDPRGTTYPSASEPSAASGCICTIVIDGVGQR